MNRLSIVTLLFLFISLFSCSEEKFEDNLFDFGDSVEIALIEESTYELLLSVDSIEVKKVVFFHIITNNSSVDSITYDFNGDDTTDTKVTNFVKSYPHTYLEEGVFTPKVTIYTEDTVVALVSNITIKEQGFDLEIEEVVVDTVDTLTDNYVEDTTLSIGSAPIIAFIDGKDTIVMDVNDSFQYIGAIAYDDEDGKLEDIFSIQDSILLTLPQPFMLPTTLYSTYKVQDSHGNVGERKRTYVINNKNINRFNLSDIGSVIYDDNGHPLDKMDGYYISTELLPMNANGVSGESTILLRGHFEESEETQCLFTIRNSESEIYIVEKTGTDLSVRLIQGPGNDTIQIDVPDFVYTEYMANYVFVTTQTEFTIYKNNELFFTYTFLEPPYKFYYEALELGLSVGAAFYGENSNAGFYSDFNLYRFALTEAQIMEL